MQEVQVDFQQARDVGVSELEGSLEKGLNSLGACAMHLAGLGMQGQLKGALLQASPFLSLFGIVLLDTAFILAAGDWILAAALPPMLVPAWWLGRRFHST